MTVLAISVTALFQASCLIPSQARSETTDRWITLGTGGGPAAHANAAQISNALVVNDEIYLFDAGDGVRQQMVRAKLRGNNIRAIFLSHHHPDHNADLGPLVVSNWLFHADNKLRVIGPPGTATLASGLAAANQPTATASFPVVGPEKPPIAETFEVSELPVEIDEAQVVYKDENVRVLAITVDHFQVPPSTPMAKMPSAVAYRIETEGRVIVYTGDTGESSRLEKLARGADILVSEVIDVAAIETVLRGSMPGVTDETLGRIVTNLRNNHLTPSYIGQMSTRAGVGKVVLTHYVPTPRGAEHRHAYVDSVKQSFDGDVLAAEDLDEF